MSLVCLVYVSYEAYPMSDAELRDILHISRERNQQQNITGMLLYRDGFFIQALEGEDDVVTAVYEKIATDPRHKNVLLVEKSPIATRVFTQWAMGFNKYSNSDMHNLDGFTNYLDTQQTDMQFFSGNPSHAKTLLDSFRDRTFF